MRRTVVARLGFALVAVALAFTAKPSAYVLYGWKWATLQVPYYINPANSDVSEGAAITAVQAAADAWRLQTNTPFSLYYGGYTSGSTATNNGKNEVFFRNSTNGSAGATTYYWSSGGRALDADILFWDGAFTFFAGNSGCSGGLYIEDVATHEFGHALGLAHSSVGSATMAPTIEYCGMSFRSLDGDDVQAIESLYPPSVNNPPVVNDPPTAVILSPSSGATFSAGSAQTLSGSAQDPQDGNINSKIVWSSNLQGTLGTGGSIVVNLQPGTHTIMATVTDSGGASAQAIASVIVNAPVLSPSFSVTLTGVGRKQKGLQKADLRWTGATSSMVDVIRNGAKRATAANSGSFTDNIDAKGTATYNYFVCDSGTTNCSNTVRVTF